LADAYEKFKTVTPQISSLLQNLSVHTTTATNLMETPQLKEFDENLKKFAQIKSDLVSTIVVIGETSSGKVSCFIVTETFKK
jgi:hypothetical protein